VSDVLDMEARRRLRELRLELQRVEAERLKVHQQRLKVHQQVLETAEAYDALHGQAARWLRRLRRAQRVVQSAAEARQRGEGREECALALAQLAALVGAVEAQALAADPSLHPAWLGG
jgi:hypothetical protein